MNRRSFLAWIGKGMLAAAVAPIVAKAALARVHAAATIADLAPDSPVWTPTTPVAVVPPDFDFTSVISVNEVTKKLTRALAKRLEDRTRQLAYAGRDDGFLIGDHVLAAYEVPSHSDITKVRHGPFFGVKKALITRQLSVSTVLQPTRGLVPSSRADVDDLLEPWITDLADELARSIRGHGINLLAQPAIPKGVGVESCAVVTNRTEQIAVRGTRMRDFINDQSLWRFDVLGGSV